MTLDEIFKTNPALRDAPEVQLLMEQAQKVHADCIAKYFKIHADNTALLSKLMHSEAIVIGGTSYEQTVKEMLEMF